MAPSHTADVRPDAGVHPASPLMPLPDTSTTQRRPSAVVPPAQPTDAVMRRRQEPIPVIKTDGAQGGAEMPHLAIRQIVNPPSSTIRSDGRQPLPHSTLEDAELPRPIV